MKLLRLHVVSNKVSLDNPFYLLAQQQLTLTALELKRAAPVFHQQDFVENFYFIASGEVRLFRNTLAGDEVCMAVLHAGETLAEASLFSEYYQCAAVAQTDTFLYSVTKADFLGALNKEPKLMQNLLLKLAQQVRQLRFMNELKDIKSARVRVLTFLANQPKQTYFLNQPLTVLASHIGLVRETLYRELAKLAKEGRIEKNQQWLKLK